MSRTKKISLTALFVALCVVLPFAFHSVPNAGSVFLPMHIPVLLAGIILGWPFGLVCGPRSRAFVPSYRNAACSHTTRHGLRVAVYGSVSGLIPSARQNRLIGLYVPWSEPCSQADRRGVLNALIFKAGKYSLSIWLTSYFVTSLPGIVIQLVLIPSLVYILQRSGLVATVAKSGRAGAE